MGGIRFITRHHVESQADLGRVLCRGCGVFFNEEGSMRQHVQNTSDTRCLDAEAARYYEKPCRDAPGYVSDMRPQPQPSRRALEPGIAAARDGQLPVIRALAADGRWDPRTAVDHHGNGPLDWAAGSGHLE